MCKRIPLQRWKRHFGKKILLDKGQLINLNKLMALTKGDLSKIKVIVKTEIEPVKKDLKKIDKTLTSAVKLFDTDYRNLKQRADRVDRVLNLPPIPPV